MKPARWLAAAFLIALAPDPASAICGVQLCELPSAYKEARESQLKYRTDFQYAEFDLQTITGHYFRTNLRAEYRLARPITIGAVVPIVALNSSTGNHTGLGNPVLFAQYAPIHWNGVDFAAGLQLEIPGGGDEHGIGSDHIEFLPYITAEKRFDKTYIASSLGFRLSGGDEHGGSSGPPLLVDPHEDQELLCRLRLGLHRLRTGIAPELFMDLQKPVNGIDSRRTFLTGGVSISKRLSDLLEIRPWIELPLTSPKRLQWRASLSIRGHF